MTKFVVVDQDNDQVFGPFDSEEEAEADLLEKATKNKWPEVLEVATHFGWLSDDSTATGQRFGTFGLQLKELIPPEVKEV